jgi:hypothetical protein
MNDLNRLAEAIRAYACEDYDADDDDLDEDEDFKEEVEELIFQAFIPVVMPPMTNSKSSCASRKRSRQQINLKASASTISFG